ncbi:type II toxin-antitoxin system HicB family antitoxin [Fodinicurvata sp. EGI_FJ10296]|uniref:type II toxin-antitoxin system HicB family antitoxin n=1 Tax=Fodinicurvata sp. EGI_FJ10296 TaxID=3231908 RepID=UPI003454F3CC
MPTAYALIHEENGVFGISFPDFPGCISTGPSEEEAIRKGSEALTFHVMGMVEDGEPIPDSRPLRELKVDPAFEDDAKDGVLVLISYELPSRAVRVNISMDENLLHAIDRAAQTAGQSRSAYLSDAARVRIRAAG